MRNLIFAMFGIMLLFYGCATTATTQGNETHTPISGPNVTSPPPGGTNPTCPEYCITQPHAQCNGNWNISGNYPGCICSFECVAQSANETPQPPPINPEEPLAEPTNKSIDQMLQDGMERQKSEFYSTNDGSFSEKSYTWSRKAPPSGGMVFDLAPASDVEFDGKTIDSIQASGFTVFKNNADETERIYGIAIFNDTRTMLDNITGADTFDMEYSPPMIDRSPRDCWVYTKDFNLDAEGGWLLTYFFKCEKAIVK